MRLFTTILLLLSLLSDAHCNKMKPADFLDSRHRTSAFSLTDGEDELLPCFSGETATCLYTVYFLGRTEKERAFWDVYNKSGFWKGKDCERPQLYVKNIEQHIIANIKQYAVFAIAINKSMIKHQADDFLPDANAVYVTYLQKGRKWIAADSFNVENTPTNTAAYLMNVLAKTNEDYSMVLGDSLVGNPNFQNEVNASCAENANGCILEKLKTNYYNIFSNCPNIGFDIDPTHKLRFKNHHEKSDVEIHIQAYAVLYANDVAADSILCYEYHNNANTLSCCEQIYYIDIKRSKLWTVWINYDVESATAEVPNVYTIDLKANRFVRKVTKEAQP